MFLFIFESLGTSELILIGIIALVFLGPRKLPEMARKIGKMMAEFRGTANEFKETWRREVDFEDEKKALSFDDLLEEPVARVNSIPAPAPTESVASPQIKEIDPARFENIRAESSAAGIASEPPASAGGREAEQKRPGAEESATASDLNDKKNWL